LSLTQRLSPGARGSTGDGAGPSTGRSRRLAKGHWVALTLGLLAFLVNMAVLRDRRETVRVAVADQEITAFSELSDDVVRYVEVPAEVAESMDLADADDVAAGIYTTDNLQEGVPLTLAETVEELPHEGLRSMSIPVGREHAAGGDLSPGDRVDVIRVSDDGQAEYAAADVEVLAVGDDGGGGLGEQATQFHVVVAVDEAEALSIAEALGADQVEVVRSTGATVATGAVPPPGAPTSGGAPDGSGTGSGTGDDSDPSGGGAGDESGSGG
jgi:Flp pilus assembly protein CpaB